MGMKTEKNILKTHEFKIGLRFFDLVWDNKKAFELRKDDRGFRTGDAMILREWSKETGYTGRYIVSRITSIISKDFGLRKGWVCIGFEILKKYGVYTDKAIDPDHKESHDHL